MSKLKRILALVATFVMIFSLTACSNANEKETNANESTKKQEEVVTTPEESGENTENNKSENVTPSVNEGVGSIVGTEETVTESPTVTEPPVSEIPTDPSEGENVTEEVWGDNKFEALLPEPPKGYELYSENNESMILVVWDMTDEKLKVWEDYINSLTDYGFEVSGDFSYSYRAQEASGNFADFSYWEDGQHLDISIFVIY